MSVVTLRSHLSEEDLHALMRGRCDADRAQAAAKLCRRIGVDGLAPAEREAAEEILQLLAVDAAVAVRHALATTLGNSPDLPAAVARRLADDIDAIATPVLERSPVLSDDDLVAVLASGGVAKRVAIAGRAHISADVVDAILDTGAREAVARAVANDGADFDTQRSLRALREYPGADVAEAFVERSFLPPSVAEALVSAISDAALERLTRRHALPPQLAVDLAEGARERATIDLLDQAGCAQDMTRFVQQLQLNGRLTPSLVIRGLCLGHVRFFEYALAEMAGLAHAKAWLLIHDAGPLGLRAIFERARMPHQLYGAARAAIDAYHEIELEGGPSDRARLTELMIERVLTRRHALPEEAVTYLLDKLNAMRVLDGASRAAGAAQEAG